VFKKAGVKGAHAHRFRHTLATDLLAKGATCEDVADILGNSPNIVRKHYAKWSRAREERITGLMQSVYGSATYPLHQKNSPVTH
jgi:integrase